MTRRASITTLLTVSLTLMPLAICGCTGSGILSEGDTLEQDSSSTSGSAPSSTSAGSTDDGESAESGTMESDIPPTQPPPPSGPCNLFKQNCPDKYKCVPLAAYGYDLTACVPYGRQEPGEPCEAIADGFVGEDDCDASSICLDFFPETTDSVCVELCVGTAANSSCPQPGDSCVHALNNLYICPLLCDPLIPGQCPSEQTCVPDYADNVIERFFCFPSTPETVGPGETCMALNNCSDGTICTAEESYGPDCAGAACCTPYCDLTEIDNTCPGVNQQCVALFDPEDPNFAAVGSCIVP